MATIQQYNIPNHYKGDTFDGVQFTIINNDNQLPIDLTNVSIDIKFRKGKETGMVIKSLSNAVGITIVDAINGVFKIDSFILDWNVDTYYYDVQFTFENGVIKTYIKGLLRVIQDVTYG